MSGANILMGITTSVAAHPEMLGAASVILNGWDACREGHQTRRARRRVATRNPESGLGLQLPDPSPAKV